ncbi:hypothetical protein HYW46_02455 [Candidatus Daviesbacteria bacterium]|nr:hypothetical protein [Candidatus Daviesbacteria bacterium]
MAERNLENVEVSEEAVTDYAKKGFGLVGEYAWTLAKYGAGLGVSGWGLEKGYNFVAGLPVLSNVNTLIGSIDHAPAVIAVLATGFAGWRAKKHVDNWLEKHA